MARDNGLPADSWAHVADLDPRVAHAALAALREAGVAAYTIPHAGNRGAYLDVQLPARPTDRLYVEAGAVERAVVVLTGLNSDGAGAQHLDSSTLAPDAAQIDAAFAEIVAGMELEDPTRGRDTDVPPADPTPKSSEGRVIRAVSGWDDLFFDEHLRQPDTSAAAEEGFVPPPPPPVPHGTPLRRFAWAAVIGCPLLVVLVLLTGRRLEGWFGLLVIGGFVGGLGALFATLGERDDDGDDGAVV